MDGRALTATFAYRHVRPGLAAEIWRKLFESGDHALLAEFLTLIVFDPTALEAVEPDQLRAAIDTLAQAVAQAPPSTPAWWAGSTSEPTCPQITVEHRAHRRSPTAPSCRLGGERFHRHGHFRVTPAAMPARNVFARTIRSPNRRCAMCPHWPPCPPADRPDRDAAHTVAFHPEQGWSLLCNEVIVFDDTGEILPDGRVVPPHLPAHVRLPYAA